MFTFEYRFYPLENDKEFIYEFIGDIQSFFGSLVNNGMILEDYQNITKSADLFTCRVVAPETDSLETKNFNKYNFRDFDVIKSKSASAPNYLLIGENFDVNDSCSCKGSSHYVLYTTYCSSVSPIICGDCLSAVPLYKFPKTYDDSEYFDVLTWQKTYRACDVQFMKDVGERHGYYMIHNPKSALAKAGLKICRYLEERVEKPFYYFLFDYYSRNKPICPNCGQDWINDDYSVLNYDFVCQKCRLVSNKCKSGIER